MAPRKAGAARSICRLQWSNASWGRGKHLCPRAAGQHQMKITELQVLLEKQARTITFAYARDPFKRSTIHPPIEEFAFSKCPIFSLLFQFSPCYVTYICPKAVFFFTNACEYNYIRRCELESLWLQTGKKHILGDASRNAIVKLLPRHAASSRRAARISKHMIRLPLTYTFHECPY